MRHFARLCVCLAFLGCGGADTSTPATACNAITTAVCNKEYACDVTLPGSASGCSQGEQAEDDCAHYSCPQGTVFSSSNAGQCVEDVDNANCSAQEPASCTAVCQ
jgi:hypothetical protein